MGVAALVFLALFAACGTSPSRPVPAPVAARVERPLPLCRPWTAVPCVIDVGAYLHRERSGKPLAGKSVRFIAGRNAICDSVTDREGYASCRGVAPSGRAITEKGYRVVFEGDERFAAASARVKPERPAKKAR